MKHWFQMMSYALVFLPLSALSQSGPNTIALTANPIFQKECAKCHGKNATGRHFAGPSLLNEKVAGASPEDLKNIIENGQKRMPKFADKLTPAEIDRLVAEINALNHK